MYLFFFFLILLSCIMTAVCVNHIDVSDKIVCVCVCYTKISIFSIEEIFLLKSKQSTFSYF